MTETTELQVHDDNRIDRHEEADNQRDEAAAQERPKTARDLMMEEIHQRRIAAINKELRQGEIMADDAREKAGFEAREHNPEDLIEDPYGNRARGSERHEQEEAEQFHQQEQKPAPTAPALRTVTVDGTTFSVSEEQYATLAGLGARTNIALQQHNQQQQNQPPNYHQPRGQVQQQPQPQRQAAPVQQALTDEEAAGVAERLIYGGKEQVAQTVKDLSNRLVERTRQEQVDANAIAQQATRQALEAQQLASDMTTISTEYPKIWEQRVLGELAAVQLNHVRQEMVATGRQMTNLEMYREACNRVEAAIGTPRTNNQVNNNSNAQASNGTSSRGNGRSDVLDRKRAAPSHPSANGRRASEVSAPRQETPSEIVAKMARARHQTPY